MSYPSPRYLGDGTTEAALRLADQAPELLLPGGGAVHHLATQASTRGDYGMFRLDMAASRSGPAPHFHRGMSEAFYVLHGTVSLFAGGGWTEAGAGDFLYVPPGGVHAFRNESGSAASVLILFAPGAPRETYFEELAEIGSGRRSLSAQEWDELYARHDQVMVDAEGLPGYRRP
jgi:quercetin dioxygenase-like cupin family protein